MKFSQLVVLLLSVFTLSLSSGCTSSQTENDSASATVSDESMETAEAVDNNDDLSLDLDGNNDAFADLGSDDATGDAATSSDSDLALSDDTAATPPADAPAVSSDDLSEVPLADSSAPQEAPVDEMAPDFGAPTDNTALADNGSADDAAGDTGSDMASNDTGSESDFGAPAESAQADFGPSSSDASSDAGFESTAGASVAATDYIPLKKVISQPYMHNGKPVNAIYFARQGDTLKSISQKIFGGDRVDELCSINAVNCSHGLKPGDKYYYNSPQRPSDAEAVKTFYEDAGIPAQTYVAKDGDNIRDLGKTLLGNRRSWMELWATNGDVESKGELTAGTTLRYWPSTDVALPTLAQNTPPPAAATPTVDETDMPTPPAVEETPDTPAPTDDMALNDIPDVPPAADMNAAPPAPPADDFAQNDNNNQDMNQQDAGAGAAAGSMNNMEPPPPPPPPPPMASPSDHQNNMAAANGGDDPNQTMALGVGAILLLAGVALFIAIRKRRARRPVDFNTTTQTQIE